MSEYITERISTLGDKILPQINNNSTTNYQTARNILVSIILQYHKNSPNKKKILNFPIILITKIFQAFQFKIL